MKFKIGRNDPCPCGSGKKFKKCCMTNPSSQESGESFSWMDSDGFHIVTPGLPPTREELGNMTKEYQKQIRKSPIWKKMVQKYGKEKVEELLKQFRAKPG